MEEGDLDLSGSEPSFLEDGLGISGQQTDFTDEDIQDWDLNAWSDQSQQNEDFIGATDCAPPGGDTSKIYVKATQYVDGEWKCYWLDTTTCP